MNTPFWSSDAVSAESHSFSDLSFDILNKAPLTVDQRQTCYLLQTAWLVPLNYRVNRKQLALRMQETGVHGHMHKLLVVFLTNHTFQVRTASCQLKEYPLDVGEVQGSGLGPVMCNIYFASIFDVTHEWGIGFADNLNILFAFCAELDSMVESTMVSWSAAHITLEPSKEVLTVFYPRRQSRRPANRIIRVVSTHVAAQKRPWSNTLPRYSATCMLQEHSWYTWGLAGINVQDPHLVSPSRYRV